MNLEAYNTDNLRALYRKLESENKYLKALLDKADIPYAETEHFDYDPTESIDYDADQSNRINAYELNHKIANMFFSMFWGRQDVYAKRSGKGSYFPQCENLWKDICPKKQSQKKNCEGCEFKSWSRLTPDIILSHLNGYREDGTDVIGVYPLHNNGTCRFIVFDFDNHEKGSGENDFANSDNEWHDEVEALRLICKENGIDALVERSRSGRGAHLWILFDKPIEAALARNFGFLLLDMGASSVNLKSFKYYDRMYPSQDVSSSIGNLIALPLQGQAVKKGNSVFVDENWNAHPNQLVHLFATKKLSLDDVRNKINVWQNDLASGIKTSDYSEQKYRPKPWNRKQRLFSTDVNGTLSIVLADGVYIDTLNINPRLQNQIRCMATIDNPIFFKNKKLGYSNYYNFSSIYLGVDENGYIKIPRGLLEKLIQACDEARINYNIDDQRERGRPIRCSFNGTLKNEQNIAAEAMLTFDNGILSAATAFGKTVVCSYLISKRKVSTLILVDKVNLISQWTEELECFINCDESLPEYKTKTGRIKKRSSVIGCLSGSKDTLTGIIDIAMVGSLYRKGNFHDKLDTYGMVIMDECHHAASATCQAILRKVNAKYVYGVSATPIRSDNLDKINFMYLGPIRHKYTALERAVAQGIDHFVIPRFTRVVTAAGNQGDINSSYKLISESEVRNQQIINDVRECINENRTPVILTRFKEHAKVLHDRLSSDADHVFIMYGDNTPKENDRIKQQLSSVPLSESLILVATGQIIGEGFNFPRLDTLMLVAPVSFAGRLEQYVGRLNRDFEGKKDVIVYDYVDSHLQVFNKMFLKRLKTYEKIGFEVKADSLAEKQVANAIFTAKDYFDVFERDLIEAEVEIVISSPDIAHNKVERFISVMKSRQESGIKITIITEDPDNKSVGNPIYMMELIRQLRNVGINVGYTENVNEHYAVIDKSLVWHGGMNLLGKADVWDNLIRVKDRVAAAELLEISFSSVKMESLEFDEQLAEPGEV